jgi:hypothetical protein
MVSWKTIAEFPNHMISDAGVVRTVSKDCEVQQHVNKGGYLKVSIYGGTGERVRRTTYIHVLVGETFLPRKCEHIYTSIDHIDGNPLNNNATNLRWVTPHMNSYNMAVHRDPRWEGSAVYIPSQRNRPWQIRFREPGDKAGHPKRTASFKTEDDARSASIMKYYDYKYWLEEEAEREAKACLKCNRDPAI